MKAKGAKAIVEMSSQERKAFFVQALNNEVTGAQLTASFEKAMASKQSKALSNWAKSVFTEKEMKEKTYPDVISKINNLQKQGILKPSLTDQYLDSLIATSLGLELKADEVKRINELSEKIQEAEKKAPDNQFFGYSMDYFKARKEMNNYLESINPSSTLEILSGLIGRGNLLFSAKSPTTNVVSNLSSFITEPLTRRIIARQASGVNSDLIIPFIKEAHKIYQETGYDPVRMLRMQDDQKTLGESRSTTQGDGAIRKVARFYEDFVFKKLMGTPDILAGALHFADSLNLTSTATASKEGLTGEALKARAKELFLKASQVRDTKDDVADVLRLGAIENALYATFQADSWYSKIALDMRNAIDSATGDLKLGTNLEPFIKTPVNVIGAGIEYSGMTLPFAVGQMVQSAVKGNPVVTQQIARQMVRAGLGVTVGILISALLDDDDYMTDYAIANAKQKEATRLSNATYNSIRFGDKWVSLDYFGVTGVVIAGIMGARQQKNNEEKALSYVQNAVLQIRRAPIISTFADLLQWFDENKKYGKTTEDIKGELIGNLANFGYSRAVPMIMSDIAKALDDKERMNDYKSWEDDIWAKVPFARESLPPKFNDLGQVIPTENAFWTIMAGARVKTANDDKVYQEMQKLSNEGVDINISAKGLKEMTIAKKIMSPYEYNELNGAVQAGIRNAYLEVSQTPEYQEADNEGKKALLEETRRGVMEATIENMAYTERIQAEIDRLKEEKN